jgi:hypothetical protein
MKAGGDRMYMMHLKMRYYIFAGINHPQLLNRCCCQYNSVDILPHFMAHQNFITASIHQQLIKGYGRSLYSATKKPKDVFVFFNNTATMAAINNARQLKEYITVNSKS